MAVIVDHQKLLQTLKQSNRVVFTHGTYDLFHIGHLEFLKKSKALGGKLVVGIDHDGMVSLYKRKPVVAQNYRALIVSKLDFVDYVLPMESVHAKDEFDYFYMKLYLSLKPDVITYGPNFHFIREIDTKCKLIGIQNKQVWHDYSHVTTTTYLHEIILRHEKGENLIKHEHDK